ncbi:hypothetical protein [Streptomyces triculaminicus]|uniref:hypothetical protein n=1 Tax=Streptomyces triculaminicus TaxID=2816232 RepID=UPI0037D0CE80
MVLLHAWEDGGNTLVVSADKDGVGTFTGYAPYKGDIKQAGKPLAEVWGEVDDPDSDFQAFTVEVDLKDYDPTIIDVDEDIAKGTVVIKPRADMLGKLQTAALSGPGHPTLRYVLDSGPGTYR